MSPGTSIRTVLVLFLLAFGLPGTAKAERMSADSVMKLVFSYVSRNHFEPVSFEAKVYVKSRQQTRRRGPWTRYIPGLFTFERGENAYFSEKEVLFRYTPPGRLTEKETAYHGTQPYMWETTAGIVERFSLSIYDTRLFTDRILSPLHQRNARFYKYAYVYAYTENDRVCYHVRITPRFHNTQLVNGEIDVDGQTGAVRFFDLEMFYDMTRIRLSGQPGKEGVASLFPEEIRLDVSFNLMGNRLNAAYESVADYRFTGLDETPREPGESSKYDLTGNYSLQTDTTAVRTDRAYFEATRPHPLTEEEQRAYARHDSLSALPRDTTRKKRFRVLPEKTEDFLLDSHKWRLGNKGRVRLPAIITPSMFQWSKSKGFYMQAKLNLDYHPREDAGFSLEPRVGYNFKQHRFYWRVPVSLTLSPEQNILINVEAGNGNRIYSADQARDIRAALSGITSYDSLVHAFDNYDFRYYNDFYTQTDVAAEPLAGLKVAAGFRYHCRSLVEWNEVSQQSGMTRVLKSVAPRLHVDWTPGLYYYREGKRRVPLHSSYPTFMIDYERGVKWGKCTIAYERWEFDAKYVARLYALRSLYFRLGTGFYTNKDKAYFVDYANFRDNNMPEGWEDEMSGQFQLLDSRWYNESRYYVRCSAAYESPMLLFSRVKLLTRIIQKERVYCNLLSVHKLFPYCELGYGLSTHICDVALFTRMAAGKTFGIGGKFVLRLFEDW